MATSKSSSSSSSLSSSYCQYANCKTNLRKRLFRFPKEVERCEQWLKAAKNPRLASLSPDVLYKNSRLCEDHFAEWCFLNSAEKHRLVFNAIPDVAVRPPIKYPVLKNNDSKATGAELSTPMLKISNCVSLSNCVDHEFAMTELKNEGNAADQGTSPSVPSSRKYNTRETKLAKRIRLQNQHIQRLKKKIESFKERLARYKQPKDVFLRRYLLEMGVTEKLVEFIVKQVEHNLAGVQDRRFSKREKRFAYSILCKSRAAYHFLQTQIELPSEATLRRFLVTKPSGLDVCSEVIDSIAKACIDQVEVVVPSESLESDAVSNSN